MRSGRGGRLALAGLAVAAVLAGCGDSEPSATSSGSEASETSQASESEHADGEHGAAGLPSAHVHGVAVNPADDLVYLATHEGLFRYEGATPTRIGPVIDLMGFTVVGPDHFYASGHPGEGVDLPDPVGLLESTDGGRTWKSLSRQGESDFHALAASEKGVVGFDGTLRATSDGKAWRELDPPAHPYALTVSPDGKVVLATNETGLLRSADAGASWKPVFEAPQLMLVDWAADDVAVGVMPDGRVAVSDDGGLTWDERGSAKGYPQAVGASAGESADEPDVLVVTDSGLVRSRDGGATFQPYPEP